MASLSELRDGLKTRLATISGLHTHDVMPDTVIVPAAIVRPRTGEYRGSLAGQPSTAFEIIILVALARLSTAQDNLDPYLSVTGSSSIFAAIEGDRTLGSKADDLLVSGWRNYGSVSIAGTEYLSAIVDVEVYH